MQTPDEITPNGYVRRWWKEAVVYQVYPRSFYDSNGDGIGDLRGIIAKLDHIKGLGVDVIWLSPHFDSPNADNGYDIRDYRRVGTEFGTMADFDALLAAIKAAGMRLIIDLVVNHTSDEHAWFAESRSSRDNSKRDYYIWSDHKPNDWTSIFGGPAWTQDKSGDWYLHLFDPKQPDLNWDNPAVRQDVYDLMRFWLDKGVDGFRMDVIPFISKDKTFPDLPEDLRAKPQYVYANGPHVHDYLHEMNRDVLSQYDVMTVGEAFGVTLADTPKLVDERRQELDMIFQFAAVEVDRGPDGRWTPWRLTDLKAVFARQDAALDRHCWPTVFLSNHDNPRIVSRFGDDSPQWREKSAMLLATLILTMKGTPFIYQGDEMGLTNCAFSDISQFNDLWTVNAWREEVESGQWPPEAFFANQNKLSRDHARMPIPWTADGGFTTGTPWFALNPNFAEINATTGQGIYDHYARLIALRHANPALVYGDYEDIAPDHPQVFAYRRTLGDTSLLIILNFSSNTVAFDCPAQAPVVTNYDGSTGALAGWDARIYRLD
ncbi:alpha-glucosidase [Asticcacaulis sp. 201]|uniref:glycoside hydrolase family 13 protein n=1 Tax=Asticcacaulis sp. 201 TaxID=3028787 RepID=UPI002916040E|nr:alpha-glucosidase [Asticcacaulis sp. 201]MDV6332428.1 alpha-glucosidase [Asticcacaulis sp. 201]